MAAAYGYRKAGDLPATIPIFPLDGALLLPGGTLPLNIFEPRYLNMVDDALISHRLIGMVQTRPDADRAAPAVADIGCVGRITSFTETEDERYLITLTGICRFQATSEADVTTPYRQVAADFARYEFDLKRDGDVLDVDHAELLRVLRLYLEAEELKADWAAIEKASPGMLVNSLAMICPFSPNEKQALLEAETTADRRETLVALLRMGAAQGPGGPHSDEIQ